MSSFAIQELLLVNPDWSYDDAVYHAEVISNLQASYLADVDRIRTITRERDETVHNIRILANENTQMQNYMRHLAQTVTSSLDQVSEFIESEQYKK
jgi:hypothetical protein